MTYFDPDVYDWQQLKDDDVTWCQGYNDCLYDLEVACDNIIDDYGEDDQPTISKIVAEIQGRFVSDLMDWMNGKRIERVASIMDGDEKYAEDDYDERDYDEWFE